MLGNKGRIGLEVEEKEGIRQRVDKEGRQQRFRLGNSGGAYSSFLGGSWLLQDVICLFYEFGKRSQLHAVVCF